MKRSARRIALACVLLASLPAWSAVSSEARASIQIILAKTDPFDSAVPTISFDDIGHTRILTGHAGYTDLPNGPFHDLGMDVGRAGATAFEHTVGSVVQGPVSIYASTDAASSVFGPHQAVSGGNVAADDTGKRTIYESFTAPFGFEHFQRFTLSPHTSVSFVIDYELAAVTTEGSNAGLGTEEGAHAGFNMALSTGPDFEGTFSEANDFIEASEAVQSPQNQTKQGQQTLSFQNNDDGLASAYFWGNTYARGYSTGTVPEPASIALVMGGLAMLARRTRSRISRAEP